MSLHKQSEFAVICGVSNAYVTVNKTRGKIIVKDGYVDDSIEPNISFLKKCEAKKFQREPEKETEGKSGAKKKELEYTNEYTNEHTNVSHKKNNRLTNNNKVAKQNAKLSFEIDNEKKLVDTENSRILQKIRIAKLNKLEGESVPIVMVGNLITTHFKNYTIAFKNAMEKNLTRWSKNFTPEEVAQARKNITTDINQANENAIAASEKELVEIIFVSSNKKEVGESE